MGADGTGMKDGIVFAIKDLQQSSKVRSSWIDAWKPVLYSIAAVLVSIVVTYGMSRIFGV